MLSFSTIGMLVGGLGLFLLAVGMITDGLRMAAGRSLRHILTRSTQTPVKGLLTGMGITAIVQSSSAVTVATIGFVNAGLLSLYQSLGVIYGANIGTTMTGWLVAIIGFKIKVEAFALPMIGFGMMLRLIKGNTRWGSLGWALAGFGLFFIGIDVLKDAFEGMATGFDLRQQPLPGAAGVIMYVAIGFAMTFLTQSSSAAIAITLTAATGGMINIESAAAMVIGANVGTTTTAGLAVIGATSNARRVASAHVLFNLLTGVVALLVLPLLFMVVRYTGHLLGVEGNPAVTLALFHTIFNIMGVMLMWPLSARLTRFLQERFKTAEEVESKPRYLDKTIAVSPPLALNALCLELEHVAEIASDITRMAVNTKDAADPSMDSKFAAISNLGKEISSFTVGIGENALSEETSQQLPKVLFALQCYTNVSDLAFSYARSEASARKIDDDELNRVLESFKQSALEIIELALQKEIEALDEMQPDYHKQYKMLRSELLLAATQRRFDVNRVDMLIDQIYRLDRIAKQMTRGTRLLIELHGLVKQTEQKSEQVEEELSETVY